MSRQQMQGEKKQTGASVKLASVKLTRFIAVYYADIQQMRNVSDSRIKPDGFQKCRKGAR